MLTSNRIYDAFYDDYSKLTAFLHSHSYTGNPLACSAALATIEIFESDNVLANNLVLARTMRESTAHLADHPHVAEVRQAGMILAIELVQEKKNRISYPWQQRRGLKVYMHALQKGALLRPLGNVIYFMPPYIITPEQINLLADIAAAGIDIATNEN